MSKEKLDSNQAICIAGMHRSGTSMVAHLLHLCGLYLGSDDELATTGPDNSEGFWENVNFVAVNDKTLARIHAGWDFPPPETESWELRPELVLSFGEAEELIERYADHRYWGWKDPRNSLTMPFWLRLIPDLKIVICLRNPLAVARSLTVRNGTSIAFGLHLWRDYYQRLLANTSGNDRVVTHFESYFHDPNAELRRVLGRLNMPASDQEIEAACLKVTASLLHQQINEETFRAQAPVEIIEYYSELCKEAGPFFGEKEAVRSQRQ